MTGGTRQGIVLDRGGVAPRCQYTGLLPGGLSLGLEGGAELELVCPCDTLFNTGLVNEHGLLLH